MKTIYGLQSIWEYPHQENTNNEVGLLSAQLNISWTIALILYNRGYKTKEKALRFLFPNDTNEVHDPSLLCNADNAAKRIILAIKNQERILICGDYDVDGITGTSLLLHSLLELQAQANFFLPHRIRDGYGLSSKIIEKAKKAGYSLVITVDNGTCAFEALKKAAELQLDVIVTDHHQPKETPEGLLYLVNPHQKDCQYPFKELAGVGVAFKLIILLYNLLGKKIPSKIYELYMIGTIADLVPLVDENRYWVKHALEKITKEESPSITLLKKNAKFPKEKILNSTDIAFSLAPQLNALGRLDDPRNGVLFFVNDNNETQLQAISNQLYTLNEERKKKEKALSKELLHEIAHQPIHPHETGCIIKASKLFPAGIIGLIAARVNQEYAVPACIFTETTEGILKGSCRTIPQCNIFKILSNIDQSLLLSFGGHKAAAGVSLHKKNLPIFSSLFSEEVLKICKKEDFKNKINIDAFIEIDDINHKLWKDLSLMEPFGASNSTPLFCITNAKIANIKIIKEVHVKILLEGITKSVWIIFFNRVDIINNIKLRERISLVGKLTENTWEDKKILEIIGTDISL